MPQLSQKLPWEQANTKWASVLNAVLKLPILQGNQVEEIRLIANTPQAINHLLQRMPQGWIVTDNTANTVVWRTKEFTDTTITLEASATTTISIWVF